MSVTITSYKIISGNRTAEIEFVVNLQTGTIPATIKATEAALYELANARGADEWGNDDVVKLVGDTFRVLSDLVVMA